MEKMVKEFTPRMFVVFREEDIDNFRKIVEKEGAIWDGSHRIMALNVWNQPTLHKWACIYHFHKYLSMEVLC